MLLIPSINKSRSFEGVERKVYGWISDAPAQQTQEEMLMSDATSRRDTHLAHAITQVGGDARYDWAVKKLLAERWVLAVILQGCVQEYQHCTVQEIAEKYIEGEPEIGSVGVHKDDTNGRSEFHPVITGTPTEDSSQTEGTVTFDIRFQAIVPATGECDVIRLLINLEAQNEFYPGYPIIKRGIYYGCRMISAQQGPIFTNADYDKIQKVYSIWICTNPPKKFRNTITRYAIQPEALVGEAIEDKMHYDLMSVVLLCLGPSGEKDYVGVLRFLEVLLSADRQAEEKKQILEDEFHIMMTEQLESEVREMCNLSVGVMEQGIERGIAQGMEQGIERGEARFAELTKKLMEQNRTEDIIRATSDPQFKITLYQEFGIQ